MNHGRLYRDVHAWIYSIYDHFYEFMDKDNMSVFLDMNIIIYHFQFRLVFSRFLISSWKDLGYKPSWAENPSARASLARTHHYQLHNLFMYTYSRGCNLGISGFWSNFACFHLKVFYPIATSSFRGMRNSHWESSDKWSKQTLIKEW